MLMQNTLRKNEQISFDDFLGEDFRFFNKDINTEGSYKEREQALDHPDDCECFRCFEKSLLR